MNSKSILRTVIITAVAALSAVGAVFFWFGIFSEFEAPLGYFVNGSVYAPVIYSLLLTGPVLGIVFALSQKGMMPALRTLPGNGSIIIRVLCVLFAAAAILHTVLEAKYYAGGAPQKFMIIRYISWVLSGLTAVHFIRCAVIREYEASPLTCLLGFVPPLYFASLVLVTYFDRSVAVNSPIQIICQISFLTMMLSATAETGIVTGRRKLYGRYVFMLCTATVICAVFGFGTVLCFASGDSFFISIDTAVLVCAGALYFFGRLLLGKSYAVPESEAEVVGGEDENNEIPDDGDDPVAGDGPEA